VLNSGLFAHFIKSEATVIFLTAAMIFHILY